MDKTAEKWMFRKVRENYWRVASWHDPADLIQDGHMYWALMLIQYPAAKDPPHRMALFKRIFTNYIHQLSIKKSRLPEEPCDDIATVAGICSDAELTHFVLEAPTNVRNCLATVLDKPELTKRPHRRRLNGQRETTNEWLCGLIGLNPLEYNMRSQLDSYLRNP